jgi:Tol biopolymer transport system component/DNA-binding winged helix-turn-helix (wHTH) protein
MTEYRAATKDPLRFGVFEIDPSARELRKHGVRIKLQDQPFAVLLILLEKPGQLVTKEELQQRLWPVDTFVEFDKGIYNAMKRLRETLGDQAETPRYIETIPKRGYRFIGNVDAPIFRTQPTAKGSFGNLPAKTWWASAGVILLILLCGLGTWRYTRVRSAGAMRPMEVVPLVGLDGAQSRPAFSPDGNQIAFVLSSTNSPGIYTTLVSGGKPLRLTSGSHDNYPRWSPDSREIAFTRPIEEGVAIYAIPALGGIERRLYAGPATEFPNSFDWSPDGKFLAISESDRDRTHARITLLSLADSGTRGLTEPGEQDLDIEPAFSPDGSTVAFVRSNVGGMVSELYVVPTSGGEVRRLTFDQRTIWSLPAWMPDGKEIVFASSRSGSFSLWRIAAAGGTPQPVAGGSVNAECPAISLKGHQLAYQQAIYQTDILRFTLKGKNLQQGKPLPVIEAKGGNVRPQFSPDGKKIAFQSDQSGYDEIWICDSDGSNCSSLTSLRGVAGAPRWSPDGRYIAFEYHPHSYTDVYVAEIGGGQPRLVSTFPDADNGGPSWSRDGQWLYFYSDREHGRFQIYKTRVSGGPPIQVTTNGGVFGVESGDGHFFYFAKWEAPGIWRMPLNVDAKEMRVVDQPGGGTDWDVWALVDSGIYFIVRRSGSKDSIEFFDFASEKKVPIFTTDGQSNAGLAVSPDGKSILFAHDRFTESQVVLVKNFQ